MTEMLIRRHNPGATMPARPGTSANEMAGSSAAGSETGGRGPEHLVRIGAGSDRLSRNVTFTAHRALLLLASCNSSQGRLYDTRCGTRALIANQAVSDAFNALPLVGTAQNLIHQGIAVGRLCMSWDTEGNAKQYRVHAPMIERYARQFTDSQDIVSSGSQNPSGAIFNLSKSRSSSVLL